ncbi:TPA: glycoside hydrolase family protein [Escherichia coli]|nr:glycoside hydrolase family protein [Escherichia coli]
MPYRDIAGVLTVCVGHTGPDIEMRRYSHAECMALLDSDLKPVYAAIDRLVRVPLTPYQKTALATFIFNTGVTAFSKSTLLKKLNAGDYAGARDQMARWVFAAGHKWKGLMNRREVEMAISGNWMFLDGKVVKREYTKQELQQQAELQKAALLSEAESVIQPLERAVRLNMATDEERARLESWERYSVLVSRVDTANPEWPQKPE